MASTFVQYAGPTPRFAGRRTGWLEPQHGGELSRTSCAANGIKHRNQAGVVGLSILELLLVSKKKAYLESVQHEKQNFPICSSYEDHFEKTRKCRAVQCCSTMTELEATTDCHRNTGPGEKAAESMKASAIIEDEATGRWNSDSGCQISIETEDPGVAGGSYDVVILTNGPGEVAAWVKPVVRQLRKKFGVNRSRLRLSVSPNPWHNVESHCFIRRESNLKYKRVPPR
jgi:hypothetical protein